MTLIECFTDSHVDNIVACLHLCPEKMMMVGNADEMSGPIRRYQKLLKQRGQQTEITMCDVRGKDIGDICAVLNHLVQEQRDCIIDLTGGDEPVIMAVGAVLAGLDKEKRQRVRVEKFDRSACVVRDCIHDNRAVPGRAVQLTVEELILLHGGTVLPEYQLPSDLSNQDLAGLWRIVSEAPKDWNRKIALLTEFESRSDSKTQVYLPLEHLRGSISNFDQKEAVVRDLLNELQRRGIIDDRSSRNVLAYTYRSPVLRYCTSKAGNVLEVKTLLEGRSVMENGSPFFHDCRMSVDIDWDGVIFDPAERIPETRNEIDVVLMHGTTPLFISCKNGNIGDEELYKLHTVAHRFGGPYARKMLIATDLDRKSHAANRAFAQRAQDMDIFLVTDAAELSHTEWQQILRKSIR